MKHDKWSAMRRQLEDQGCEIRVSGGNHYKIYFNGKFVATMPNSPGDHRGLLNQRSQLRRLGFIIK
jgi:hypothetical protein